MHLTIKYISNINRKAAFIIFLAFAAPINKLDSYSGAAIYEKVATNTGYTVFQIIAYVLQI